MNLLKQRPSENDFRGLHGLCLKRSMAALAVTLATTARLPVLVCIVTAGFPLAGI
jgi:hypothetical protein